MTPTDGFRDGLFAGICLGSFFAAALMWLGYESGFIGGIL